jgi:hypothetical protein
MITKNFMSLRGMNSPIASIVHEIVEEHQTFQEASCVSCNNWFVSLLGACEQGERGTMKGNPIPYPVLPLKSEVFRAHQVIYLQVRLLSI